VVGLRKLLPSAGRRRRRARRPEAPRTVVPTPDGTAKAPAPARFDAARERLRAQIPPRAEDD